MIILDTQTWIWWNDGHPNLTADYENVIRQNLAGGIGVSVISCWEIAKLVEKNRLQFSIPVEDWLTQAISYSSVLLLPLTPRIAVESTQLPGTFHKDPADQIIVATARVYNCPLVTFDAKILNYKHVKMLP